jgi:hypothetical protein
LLPELVAPGVGFLACSACAVSGVVLRAAGGRFSVAQWSTGDGVDLGPIPVGPEMIAARWREIVGTAVRVKGGSRRERLQLPVIGVELLYGSTLLAFHFQDRCVMHEPIGSTSTSC